MNQRIRNSIIVILIGLIFGCYKNNDLSKIIVINDKNIQLNFYENGFIKSYGEILKNDSMSLWHMYDTSGVLRIRGKYNKSLKSEKWSYNLTDPRNKIEIFYKDGIPDSIISFRLDLGFICSCKKIEKEIKCSTQTKYTNWQWHQSNNQEEYYFSIDEANDIEETILNTK